AVGEDADDALWNCVAQALLPVPKRLLGEWLAQTRVSVPHDFGRPRKSFSVMRRFFVRWALLMLGLGIPQPAAEITHPHPAVGQTFECRAVGTNQLTTPPQSLSALGG